MHDLTYTTHQISYVHNIFTIKILIHITFSPMIYNCLLLKTINNFFTNQHLQSPSNPVETKL